MNVASNKKIALSMSDIHAAYYEKVPVLMGVNLDVQAEKITAVVGPNGSGKSTCLRVLYGFLKPSQGKVMLGNQDITKNESFRRLDLGIGFLPQGRSLFPNLSVSENLEVGGWTLRHDRSLFQSAIEASFARYPLLKEIRRKPAGSLSGGQQRFLEIARLMMTDPYILIIDEPTAGLAPILAGQIYEEVLRLKSEKKTILMVDQNVKAAIEISDYVYSLEFGRNHVQGDRAEFEHKISELVRGWLRFDAKGGN